MMYKQFSLMALMVVLIGCAIGPAKLLSEEDLKITSETELPLPLDITGTISMTTENRAEVVRKEDFLFRNGEIIAESAETVFGMVFSQLVDLTAHSECKQAELIVSGVIDDISFWSGNYKVEIKTTLIMPDNPGGVHFTATGSASSGYINDTNALKNAYLKGFTKIANNILADGNIRNSLQALRVCQPEDG